MYWKLYIFLMNFSEVLVKSHVLSKKNGFICLKFRFVCLARENDFENIFSIFSAKF